MKAQATVEFMMLFIVFMMAVLIAATISHQRILEVKSEQARFEAERILGVVGSSLDTALTEGDGFSTKVSLPTYVAGNKYNVTLQPNLVVLRVGGQDYMRQVLAKNISGNLLEGENSIKNSGGTLVIS